MDKISQINIHTTITQQKQNKQPATNFSHNLNQAIEKQTSKTNTSDSYTQKNLNEITSINFIPASFPENSFSIFNKTDKLLKIFEDFTKDINNSGKNLKELEPIISLIRQQADELINETKLIKDSDLNKFTNEFAVKANVEYIKFMRGDYI